MMQQTIPSTWHMQESQHTRAGAQSIHQEESPGPRFHLNTVLWDALLAGLLKSDKHPLYICKIRLLWWGVNFQMLALAIEMDVQLLYLARELVAVRTTPSI